MSYYKKHIFICTNQKDNNKQCCANSGLTEVVKYAKQFLGTLGINKDSKIRISSSGCMGRCELGPVLAVYPNGEWYHYRNLKDIENILSCVVQDKPCDINIITDK